MYKFNNHGRQLDFYIQVAVNTDMIKIIIIIVCSAHHFNYNRQWKEFFWLINIQYCGNLLCRAIYDLQKKKIGVRRGYITSCLSSYAHNYLEWSITGFVTVRVRAVFVHLSDLLQDRHLMIMMRFRCLLVRDVRAASGRQAEECHQPWRHLKRKDDFSLWRKMQ